MLATHDTKLPTITPACTIAHGLRAISAWFGGIRLLARRWFMARQGEVCRDLAWLSSAPDDDSWAGGAR